MPNFASPPSIETVKHWPLAVILWDLKPRAITDENNISDGLFYSTKAAICHEFLLLGKTRCSLCNGWGHSHKICPTARKLKHYGNAGASMTILKRAREKAIEDKSSFAQGKEQPWSSLPVATPTRRSRRQFEADRLIEEGKEPAVLSQKRIRTSPL